MCAHVTSRIDTSLLLRILILFVCLFRILTNEDANEIAHLPCQIQSIDAFKGDRYKQYDYGYLFVSGTNMGRMRREGKLSFPMIKSKSKITLKITYLFPRKMVLHTPVVFKENGGRGGGAERERERDCIIMICKCS